MICLGTLGLLTRFAGNKPHGPERGIDNGVMFSLAIRRQRLQNSCLDCVIVHDRVVPFMQGGHVVYSSYILTIKATASFHNCDCRDISFMPLKWIKELLHATAMCKFDLFL